MTDAEKLREIANCLTVKENCRLLWRLADLLEVVPPEVLGAIKNGTWQAVPVEPTDPVVLAGFKQ